MVAKPKKTLAKVLGGSANIRFSDAVALGEAYGFTIARVRGSHHILTHPEIPELLNFQEVSGKAKPYQMRQLMRLVERYNLSIGDDT